MHTRIKRGEIYYVAPSTATGSEQRGGRPGLIVSNEKNNFYSPTVEVVYLTTREKNPLPTHVRIRATGRESTALCEQVHTVAKSRLGSFAGRLSAEEQKLVNRALRISLELDSTKKHTRPREDAPTMYLMIGIPSSGKSTYAKELAKQTGAVWISRDAIRLEMFKEPDFSPEQDCSVRDAFIQRICETLDAGHDVIADATFLTPGSRKYALSAARGCRVVAVYVQTPLDIALQRNEKRVGLACVPEAVIRSMDASFSKPSGKEGIHELRIVSGVSGNLKRVSLLIA